jgi:hypothetical protein
MKARLFRALTALATLAATAAVFGAAVKWH